MLNFLILVYKEQVRKLSDIKNSHHFVTCTNNIIVSSYKRIALQKLLHLTVCALGEENESDERVIATTALHWFLKLIINFGISLQVLDILWLTCYQLLAASVY